MHHRKGNLKGSSRDLAVTLLRPKGQRKKVLHLKKKCVVGKRSLSQLKSLSANPEKQTNEWLNNLNCAVSQPKDNQTCISSSEDACTKTIHPAEVEPEPASSSGDSDMPSTLEASFTDQLPVEPEKSSSEDSDMTSTRQESCHKPIDTAATRVPLHENQTGLSDPGNALQSPENKPTASDATPKKLGSKSNISPQDQELKGVFKTPMTAAKKIKQRRVFRRKEFLKFYFRNSNSGFLQALKKFHNKKLAQSLKHIGTSGVQSKHQDAVNMNGSIQKRAPLKIVVKERLSSSGVARSLCPSTVKPQVITPTPLKMLSGLNLPIHKSTTHSVVSCQAPFESPFEASSSEKEGCHDGTSLPSTHESEGCQASSREVCYIFALLDREKEETLFKCSPHVKTSKVLQQIASVIDSISADEDLMISKKVYATDDDECLKQPSRIDQSTSPIALRAEPIRAGFQVQVPPAAEDVPNSSEEENSDDSGLQSDMERKDRMLNATTKVIISKALLSFTSELKVLTDVSIRLLGWCAGTIRADLDSDSFEDEFEGFLCHCHDKVSILIECLHELDLRQILNVDEAEVHRFWLLHDALRCMLQAYRYIQSSSATGYLSQKLLSLLMTCSKTMLPSGSISLTRWLSLMTMISGISTKLWEARLLSNACLCYQHFESLRKGRSCRVCDLQCFFKEVCQTEPSDPKSVNAKSSAACAAKTAVEQLFPRFCWFLSEIEGLSQEEFMTAFQKHAVVKFSCNPQSALYPCDAHLSGIACNCFAVSTDFESLSEQPEERTVGEGEAINGGLSDVRKALNESSDQQIVPLCEKGIEEETPNAQCSKENLSLGAGLNTASLSSSRGSKVVEVTPENCQSSICSDDTVIVECNDDEVVLLHEGSSESPSEDFSLHLQESSSLDPKSTSAAQLDHNGSEDDTATTDNIEGPSCSMLTNPPESPLHCRVPLANSKVSSQKDSDIDTSLSLSSNSYIDYTHPKFQVAESNIKTTILGNDSDSILSVVDSQGSSMKTSSTAEEELMRDVSFGDDDVFESISCNMKESSSVSPQRSLDSSSIDDAHSSQGIEDKRTQRLKSPPPFQVETTLEDTDSSVEMPAFGRVVQSSVSSTQGKDVEVKTLIGNKGSANSTQTKEANQIQRMKEECKRRVLRGLRSMQDMGVSPQPEANDLSQRNIRTRSQQSSSKRGEERKTRKETSDANPTIPHSSVLPEKVVGDQQGEPKDANNIHSNGSIMKRKDKKVTFNDILQFKEFTDSPLLGYGRCKRMPVNFTDVQEKIESLLTEMFPSSSGNSDDEGPSAKSRNEEKNKDDGADVLPAVVEKDSVKTRKRKLSLQHSKVNAVKENDEKRATESFTNEVSDKLKQNSLLDEMYRKTFDPEKNEGTECSLVQSKPQPRPKRTMKDVVEDDDDELTEDNMKSKNAKKLRTLKPKKSDDSVSQNKVTLSTPMTIKSCLKKTIKTQTESGVSSNMNPSQSHKDELDKIELGKKNDEEFQDIHLRVQPKQVQKLDSDSVSEQRSHQTNRKETRRKVKEMKEKLLREELKSMTEQEEVSLKSNNDDDQNAEKAKSKRGKKGKMEPTKVSVSSNTLRGGNVGERSGTTNKKKESKRSKSNLVEDVQGKNKAHDLNVSDPEWNMYLVDLKKKMLDN
ncbi:uncharacterized protein LOC117647947 isoform X2 [Thrips palmi]|nr:uncharacterized protein LOC117647947 isoform X2 [Thrips palmi]